MKFLAFCEQSLLRFSRLSLLIKHEALMKTVVATILILNCAFLVGEEIQGKVTGITDGDTIELLDADYNRHKVRLDGIDAPEKKQAFGAKADKALGDKIFLKQVRIEYKAKDRYGRILGTVFLKERNINREMVTEGMAWHYKKYSKDKELAAEEKEAREAKRGLWADKEPVPPWEFRAPAKESASK